jgi:transglutaminase-like putative cysteine protease
VGVKVRLTVIAAVAVLFSSFGLHPLFLGADWIAASVGAIVVVAGAGLLGRRFRLPAFLCLCVSLAALHLYLTLVFTGDQALVFLIPTPGSLSRMSSLLQSGWNVANHYAAPVPVSRGVTLLAAVGVGLVAIIVDFLAVRLRRAAPAGLPLLAMYSVPAAVREESIGWLAFVLGAAGFMALLLADAQEQVYGWGRHVHSARWASEEQEQGSRPIKAMIADDRRDAGALAVTGRRVGLAALVLSIGIPIFVPGIHPKGMFGLGGSGSGPGSGQSSVVHAPNALVTMHRQLLQPSSQIVLTYTTDDPDPFPEYLQMSVLDRFNGESWTQSLVSTAKNTIGGKALPDPPGLTTFTLTRAVLTHISIAKHTKDVTFLPLPYAPYRVALKGSWRVDPATMMVYSLSSKADGRSFTVESTRALPTEANLKAAPPAPPAVKAADLDIPRTVPRSVYDLAHRVVGRDRDPYRQALDLQNFFTGTGGFVYTLSAPQPSRLSDLMDFLFHSKKGYCEQFASSMALLARELGIPARVAVGYTQGSREGNQWVVRSSDAHAWPELYFDGVGWVRFEPTPTGTIGTDGQASATTPSYAQAGTNYTPGGPTILPPTQTAPGQVDLSAPGRNRRVVPQDGDLSSNGNGGGSHTSVPVGWILGGILVVLLLAAPVLVRLVARSRRWSRGAQSTGASPPADRPRRPHRTRGPAGPLDPVAIAHAAWAELRADALDHGLPWHSTDTPRATARRLTDLLELGVGADEALQRISRAEERARYATTPAPADTLRADVRTMREAFAANVSRRARIRARVAPPTALESMRTAGTHALETFDRRAGEARARLRRLLRRD